MRVQRVAVALLFGALTACGADKSTGPDQGSVFFKIDGVSCRGSDAIVLYLDGSPIGTETLTAGGAASKAYSASAGSHLIGAKEVNSPFYTWQSTSEIVPAGGSYTHVLFCG